MLRRMVALCAAVLLSLTLTTPANAEPLFLSYRGHVQNVGWQPFVSELDTAGTTGRSLRLEALTVRGTSATVQTFVQGIGWQAPVREEQTAGTTGRSLRLEAVRVRSQVPGVGIECQAHVQDIGWMPWAADGADCGAPGRGLRLEAVHLRLTRATPPAVPRVATIVAVGDLGPEAAGLGTRRQRGAEHSTAAVILGDLGYAASAQPFCAAWNSSVSAPLVWVQGNHENRDNDGAETADYAACLNGSGVGVEGVEQVANVGAFATIITASPQEGASYVPGSDGYNRIAAAIDKAQASGRWTILAMHEPHYSVGVHGPSGPDSQALSYLARDKGVRLVLTAHDHNYSRIQSGATTYIVAGMGGHKLRDLDPAAKHWPIVQAAYPGTAGAGYLRLTVTADRITGQLVGSGGDAFTITR